MSAQEPQSEPKVFDLELFGEVVLLTLTAAFFILMLVRSFSWPAGASLMPRIAVLSGLPLVTLRAYLLVQGKRKVVQAERIMDMGFQSIGDRKLAFQRLVQSAGGIVVLCVLVWVVGWHIGLPVWVAGYLWRYGKVRWWWALAGGVGFWVLVYAVYDRVFQTPWNEPLLFRLFN